MHDGALHLREARCPGAGQDRADLLDDGVDRDLALHRAGLDRGEDLANGVDHDQEHVRRRLVHVCQTVAELGQQALTRVSEALEPAELEETAGSLDGVDRAEDAAQQLARARLVLERDEVLDELVEVLVALNQKLTDDLIRTTHIASNVSFSNGWLRVGRQTGRLGAFRRLRDVTV
jgi:hypothetical protein